MTVLLVTKSDDNDSVDRVARALVKRGLTPVRLDSDRYPDVVALSTRIDSGSRTLTTSAGSFDLNDVSAVWYRRFDAGRSLPAALDDVDDGVRAACVDESRRSLLGMIAALPCVHVDTLESVRRCDHKELQLVRASALGLDVPRTLFTNDATAARAFFDDVSGSAGSRGVITKMQSSFALLRDEKEHVVFTSVVERAHLDDGDGLRFCPMIFQEQLDKALDVRATVVGDRVLSASLTVSSVDWRTEGAARVNDWRPYTLPDDVERSLLALVRELGLTYAACDFVVTGEGRCVFLEVNAGGEWLWLDDLLGITDALADVLAPAQRLSPNKARMIKPRAARGAGR